MSTLRDRSNRLRPRSRGKAVSFFGALTLLAVPLTVPAATATGPAATVGMYLDQPFVQGSYVAEDFPTETSVTTFSDQSWNDTCSFNGSTLEALYSSTPDCRVQTELNFGAASSTSSTPTFGQFPDSLNYGQVGSGGASIVFDTPQTYFGMWWSAGSVGNEVQLLNGSTVVASTSANDVASVLNSAGTLTSQGGDSYATKFYISNPIDWSTVGSPTDFSDLDESNTYQYVSNFTVAREPFVYIHFIAEDGYTFDRVNLIAPGNGFEFDNFTTSTATGIRAGIPSRLVLQKQLYEATYVDFDANGGSGAMPRQYAVDNSPSYLQSSCFDSEDPTRCISALNNSYGTQLLGWNTARDGGGDAYYFENWLPFPFTESTTLYAQWQTYFYFYNMTNPDADASNVWEFSQEDGYDSKLNYADLTLPATERSGQYIEGWYTFTSDWSGLMRVGGPGDAVSGNDYTTWSSGYLFARWIEDTPPPPSVDAVTPEVLLVHPRATSVQLPNMPLVGDTSGSICLVESDLYGTEISSSLSFTDLTTSTSGFSTSYSISSASALVTSASRYVRVTVSTSADTTCTTGFTHNVELRPLGAKLTQVIPLNLTVR